MGKICTKCKKAKDDDGFKICLKCRVKLRAQNRRSYNKRHGYDDIDSTGAERRQLAAEEGLCSVCMKNPCYKGKVCRKCYDTLVAAALKGVESQKKNGRRRRWDETYKRRMQRSGFANEEP